MELGTPLLEDEVSESQTQEYFENLELHALVSKLQNENIRLHAALRRSETVINQLNAGWLQKNPLWKDMTPAQKIKRNSEISLKGQVKSADAVKMPSYDAQLKMYEEQIENTSPEIKFLIEKIEEARAKKEADRIAFERTLEEANVLAAESMQKSEPLYGGVLKIDNLEKEAASFLTEKAKEKMGNKSKSTIQNDGDKFFRSVYYSLITKGEDEKLQAIKLLSELANELAEKDLVHSVLSPISSLELFIEDVSSQLSNAVFFFPLVPVEKENELPHREWISLEGGIGPRVPMP